MKEKGYIEEMIEFQNKIYLKETHHIGFFSGKLPWPLRKAINSKITVKDAKRSVVWDSVFTVVALGLVLFFIFELTENDPCVTYSDSFWAFPIVLGLLFLLGVYFTIKDARKYKRLKAEREEYFKKKPKREKRRNKERK